MDARQKIEAVKWRCFHCDEAFTDEAAARDHFGRSERQSPACQIDAAEYRKMEARMLSYNEEDSEMHRQIYRMESAHAAALKAEEEKGYARGLTDGAPYLAEREATIATHTAEIAAREAEIANQALNYVSLFGELQNAMAEIARLREVLMNVKVTLVIANETKDGPIVDTIWHGPAETLFDYIDNSFTQQPTKD